MGNKEFKKQAYELLHHEQTGSCQLGGRGWLADQILDIWVLYINGSPALSSCLLFTQEAAFAGLYYMTNKLPSNYSLLSFTLHEANIITASVAFTWRQWNCNVHSNMTNKPLVILLVYLIKYTSLTSQHAVMPPT